MNFTPGVRNCRVDHTHGKTVNKALENLKDAIQLYLNVFCPTHSKDISSGHNLFKDAGKIMKLY
jgi:predicted RNase H-like HicB family nuclease